MSCCQVRHIGDLGNIRTDSAGHTTVDIHDNIALLDSPHTILGKTIVIHAGKAYKQALTNND